MNRFRKLLSGLAALAVVLLAARAADRTELPGIQGQVRGFTVPARGYLLKGDTAEFLSGGRVQLSGVTVATRLPTNEINFTFTTPSGEYHRDATGDMITSTNTLDVRSQDGRFQLGGRDYVFRPYTNTLVINADVTTTFDQSLFSTTNAIHNAAADQTNRPPLVVTSTALEFNGSTGDAAYRKNVALTDGSTLRANAGEVLLNVAAMTNVNRRVIARDGVRMELTTTQGVAIARAAQAILSTSSNVEARVEMTGNPLWTKGLISGSGGTLNWQSVSNQYEFTGTGGTTVRFPSTMFGTNKTELMTTNLQWIDIRSDRHRFVPGKLEFDGQVVAQSSTNWLMSTRRFAVDLDATNKPTRMEAQSEFHFEIHDGTHAGHGEADHALVNYTTNGVPKVSLNGQPRWISPEFEKRADVIEVVDPTGDAVYTGDGHVELKLLGLNLIDLDWFGVRTNNVDRPKKAASTNQEPVLITAEHSRYHAGFGEFSGNVQVMSGTNSLFADRLTLQITPDNRLTNLVASGHVKVHQGGIVLVSDEIRATFDGTPKNIPHVDARGNVQICGIVEGTAGRATGKTLSYDGDTGEATLDGDPEIIKFGEPDGPNKPAPPPYLIKAGQIVWNMRTGERTMRNGFSGVNLPADSNVNRNCD